jgi:small subunit ribosomal protein S20
VANIKSAQKRIELNKRNKIQNRVYKSLIKTSTKKYFLLIEEYKQNPNEELLKVITKIFNKTYSNIDKALKKKVIHKNTASRKKSQIGLAMKN